LRPLDRAWLRLDSMEEEFWKLAQVRTKGEPDW